MAWELIEVPGNLNPSLEDSTVDVVAAKIDPKLANTLIRQLSQVCPLENLRHVKRVRRHTECGKSELSIILCVSSGSETCSIQFSEDLQKIMDTYQLSPFTAKVAGCCATSKEEWEEQCKLWPTSYHPAHDLGILRGFQEEELPSIFNYMKTAIQLSKPWWNTAYLTLSHYSQMLATDNEAEALRSRYTSNHLLDAQSQSHCLVKRPKSALAGNAAIIVDPSSMQIIAKATDQTHKHHTPEGNTFSEANADVTCSLNASTDNDSNLSLPGSFLPKGNSLNMEISCINPWGWMKKRTCEQKPLPCDGCFAWHPLRHAPMVAIENAAERDRTMFPSSTSITKPDSNGNPENCCDNEPAKRLKVDTKDNEQSASESFCGDLSETSRPYLCTGFDIYLVWEPCTMCAMALVHHRFKRVFYALPNPVTGALGGVYRLHGERSLNHHYNVFRVSVPEAYTNGSNYCSKEC